MGNAHGCTDGFLAHKAVALADGLQQQQSEGVRPPWEPIHPSPKAPKGFWPSQNTTGGSGARHQLLNIASPEALSGKQGEEAAGKGWATRIAGECEGFDEINPRHVPC